MSPGHRLAKDPKSGAIYSLFQRRIADGAGGSKNIDYMLNRSTDGGQTWPLGGGSGMIVANADSTQPWPKFGTVNALLGGALHAAVDLISGDLYYVYGNRDAVTGNNRLAIRRLTADNAGNIRVGAESFVTDQVEAAIPSVAVTPNGTMTPFSSRFKQPGQDARELHAAWIEDARRGSGECADLWLPGTGVGACSSLAAERSARIRACGAARRHQASQAGGAEESRRHGDEGDRIGRRDVEQHSAQKPGKGQSRDGS